MLPMFKPKSPLTKQHRVQRQNQDQNIYGIQNNNQMHYQFNQPEIGNQKYSSIQSNKRIISHPAINTGMPSLNKNKQNNEAPITCPIQKERRKEKNDVSLQCDQVLMLDVKQRREQDNLLCNQILSYLGNGSSNQNSQRKQACSPESILDRLKGILSQYQQRHIQDQKIIKKLMTQRNSYMEARGRMY